MNKLAIATNIIFCFFLTNISLSQTNLTENILKLEEGSIQPLANIDAAKWLSGSWRGEAFGGVAEEVWSQPSAGTMMGMFRAISEGEVIFYEFFALSELNGSLILKLKHFNKDLTGWEEKDESVIFELVKVEEDALYFSGITMKRISDSEIVVYVASESEEGIEELKFEYKK